MPDDRPLALAAVAAATAAVLAVFRLRHRYARVVVEGTSMLPTYAPGDRVLVRRAGLTAVHVGDVVIVAKPDPDVCWLDRPGPAHRAPHGWLIKRVVAVPGDPVPRDRVAALATVPERAVPPGKLVVLGDAGTGSLDSRHLGYLSGDDVLGVARRPRRAPTG